MAHGLDSNVDFLLVGGGIMSATLGAILSHVSPDASLALFERSDEAGSESSGPWNNAGTGHAGLCELNYTPERPDGTLDISKAVVVNEQFHQSLQFWASLVRSGELPAPSRFITRIPHMSYVGGSRDVDYLRRRYDALAPLPLFEGMELSEDRHRMEEWVPLMMQGRTGDEPIAMTRIESGTDVNFGAITRSLIDALRQRGAEIAMGTEVAGLRRTTDGRWSVTTLVRRTGERRTLTARFVFIGAGGTAIHLLQRSGIAEAKGYGGFPVSGQFLRCTDAASIDMHRAKVYGKSQVKAPPMAMPHLDRRVIDGDAGLLFGPYAGFTPKFLKQGSNRDFLRSVRPDNLSTLLSVARDEFDLTRYLIGQARQTHEARIANLRDFVPTAEGRDWELIHAGQRVQTMKRLPGRRSGAIAFGTELVCSRDGTLAGVLGASPGASTAVSIMLDVLKRCFPDRDAEWRPSLRELIPSVDVALSDDPSMRADVRLLVEDALDLGPHSVPVTA